MPEMDGTWPEELDALTAAPEHHTLLFENEFVRVIEVLIKPGEETKVHTHQWPASLYSLSSSCFIRYDAEKNILLEAGELAPPLSPVIWLNPIPPHTLRNTGTNDIHNICVELKNTSLNPDRF